MVGGIQTKPFEGDWTGVCGRRGAVVEVRITDGIVARKSQTGSSRQKIDLPNGHASVVDEIKDDRSLASTGFVKAEAKSKGIHRGRVTARAKLHHRIGTNTVCEDHRTRHSHEGNQEQ